MNNSKYTGYVQELITKIMSFLRLYAKYGKVRQDKKTIKYGVCALNVE